MVKQLKFKRLISAHMRHISTVLLCVFMTEHCIIENHASLQTIKIEEAMTRKSLSVLMGSSCKF